MVVTIWRIANQTSCFVLQLVDLSLSKIASIYSFLLFSYPMVCATSTTHRR